MSGIIPEVSHPTIECPEPQRWSCYDPQTAEIEVLKFLESLVHTIKPDLVVETGTHMGWSAIFMGRALQRLGRGRLITCEVDPRWHQVAETSIRQQQLSKYVECCHAGSLELKVDGTIDLLFCDSDPQVRMHEINHFWNQLSASSVIVVHDVNSGNHRTLRKEVLAADLEENRLSVILLPTPRGLAVAQKCKGRQ